MRYDFYSHPSQQGWFRVCDLKWECIMDFQEHKFNETQVLVDAGRLASRPDIAAEVMSEMGDWIAKHHYFEAMPPSAFELRFSENDSSVSVIRRKEPRMEATFYIDDLDKIASTLAKASEFIRKRAKR